MPKQNTKKIYKQHKQTIKIKSKHKKKTNKMFNNTQQTNPTKKNKTCKEEVEHQTKCLITNNKQNFNNTQQTYIQ